MSASLVGSEMCIRDRCDTGVLPGLLPCVLRPVAPPASPAAARRHRGGGCLLYTSDAADDM
eukprot:13440885-Alexandrium_andersonii.AAC.1